MNEGNGGSLDWFNGYVDQSVTFTSWRKVESKMCQILKQNTEKKLMDPVNRQILFQILGTDFVNKYFSSYTNSPAVLENIRVEERERKFTEMKGFVASVMDSALQTNGLKSDSKVQSDLSVFSRDIENTVESDLQDQLSENKSKKKSKTSLHEKYLSEIFQNDPALIEDMFPKLSAQVIVLSDNLRMNIWPASFATKEKSKSKKNSEKTKDKFSQLYSKFQYSSDTDEDSNHILPTVNKVYKETKCMQSFDSEENAKFSAKLLKLCEAYGRKFQLQFVYYAIVIQQVYLKDSQQSHDDQFINAAFLLEQVLRVGAPNSNRTVKIAKKVCETLSEVDKQLDNHLKEMLSKESSELREIQSDDTISSKDMSSKRDIMYYLNKWISNGFTSILKPNLLFFVWDQLFLNKWENKIFQDICMALLGLLKPWFMNAKNNDAVQKVFKEEPSFLYLLDLRSALSHIQKRKPFGEIPPMNRNIKQGHIEPPPPKPPSPVKIPTPPPVRIPTPPPPKPVVPIPKPVLPPPQLIPWVPYNKDKMKEVGTAKSKVDLPFDLYVDSVRFVPDNATVVKVTGKVLNMYLSQKGKSIKFQIFPEMESCWRYPKFKFKQAINLESIPMNPDTVIMLRVYTIEHHSKKTCVLGSCLFGPFSNKHGKQASLRVGGHQLRIRHGIPDPDFNVEHMLASHMDNNPLIPGMTILLRVLPHSQEYVSPSEYEKNIYRSELAKPNESEKKLYKHYQDSKDISMAVRDVALLLIGQASANNITLSQTIQKDMQKEGSDVEDFPYQRYVHYNKNHGMMVLVDKAAGLPLFLEGRYLQCLVQIFPGEDSKIGNGKSQVTSFLTNDLELDSPQRAPDWSDHPTRVSPDYDSHAFILLSLYGLRPRFDATNQKLLDKEGKEPKFNIQQAIAWSAMRCFDKDSVYAGIHQIPLLKGRPPDDIIEKLSYLPLDYLCQKFKTQVKIFEAASIEVSIWDGHFTNSECPPLPVHTDLLNISNNPSRYIKAAQQSTGPTAADLLRNGLNNPSEFSKHKNKILELLSSAFKNNLDVSLLKSGYAATI
ncbi:hypothetical protein JTE90_011310 [Oedothorax gibbosus]|uniref:Uncharacterized protein n=1 Tax=Oedothorax gibbosus TaxID=931172 RepID=A0AAV6VKQ7_9ARAC|nr:hypothetical protein JTE90_011310 [Oedothorax gibbosus]